MAQADQTQRFSATRAKRPEQLPHFHFPCIVFSCGYSVEILDRRNTDPKAKSRGSSIQNARRGAWGKAYLLIALLTLSLLSMLLLSACDRGPTMLPVAAEKRVADRFGPEPESRQQDPAVSRYEPFASAKGGKMARDRDEFDYQAPANQRSMEKWMELPQERHRAAKFSKDIEVLKDENISKSIKSAGKPLEVPLFPWPPPKASAKQVIPNDLLKEQQGATLLRDVDKRITDALARNGYYESSYYAVPEGFALVTKMEQIDADGTPKQGPARWTHTDEPLGTFDLMAYLNALVFAKPGYYRVIVFVVTPFPFTQADVKVTPKEADTWLGGGLNCLPASIGKLDFSGEGYECTALVYEFERPSQSDEPKIQVPGHLQGRTHLVKAGLWEAFKKWPQ